MKDRFPNLSTIYLQRWCCLMAALAQADDAKFCDWYDTLWDPGKPYSQFTREECLEEIGEESDIDEDSILSDLSSYDLLDVVPDEPTISQEQPHLTDRNLCHE